MVNSSGVRCMILRGGTSKGAYFLKSDLPADAAERDDLLLRVMGSPDARQIDGIGGAKPLTSKVAVVSHGKGDIDVEYLFLQVGVERATVSDRQNCGNLLAGVAQFAVERHLIEVSGDEASVRILMVNTGSTATATFPIDDGRPVYFGDSAISGVPGTAAPVRLDFEGIAGSSTGALLPTGNVLDVIDGIECTLIDNGMPVIVLRAADVGVTGYESPAELDANEGLGTRIERIRLEAGPLMGLGDVTDLTIPKITLVAPPRAGGDVCTRTFIPHRVHDAIGVLGAVSVGTAILLPGTPGASMTSLAPGSGNVLIEHPTGSFGAAVDVLLADDGSLVVKRAGIIRTARKLMDGVVFPRQ